MGYLIPEPVRITFPFPPVTGNHAYKFGKGRVYKTAEAKNYCDGIAKKVKDLGYGELFPKNVPLKVEVHFFPPDDRRRDLDNAEKVFMDGITLSHLWDDDCQIVTKFSHKEPGNGWSESCVVFKCEVEMDESKWNPRWRRGMKETFWDGQD